MNCSSSIFVNPINQIHDNKVEGMSINTTANGKTFEWENFRGQYANDHSQESCRGCTTASRRILHEIYRITYSTKICGKIFAIECKIMKTAKFSHSKVLPYTV